MEDLWSEGEEGMSLRAEPLETASSAAALKQVCTCASVVQCLRACTPARVTAVPVNACEC